jgi:hypothetical protein
LPVCSRSRIACACARSPALASKAILVFGEVAWQEPDGHGAAQRRVVREIHLAHPPCAEQRADFVAAQSCSGGEMHGGGAIIACLVQAALFERMGMDWNWFQKPDRG